MLGKKITPALDPCKDKKRLKIYDPELKWTKNDRNLGRGGEWWLMKENSRSDYKTHKHIALNPTPEVTPKHKIMLH